MDNNLQLIKIQRGSRGTAMVLMIKTSVADGGRVLGFLEKFNDTSTESHPYKIFHATRDAASGDIIYDSTRFMIPVYGTRGRALDLMMAFCTPVE